MWDLGAQIQLEKILSRDRIKVKQLSTDSITTQLLICKVGIPCSLITVMSECGDIEIFGRK